MGLDAAYYNSSNFSGRPVRQIDTLIEFNWGSVPPAIGMRGGEFSARWTGSLTPQYSERYTLHLGTVGEAWLWLDDRLILQPGQPSATLELSNTRAYALRLEFRKTQPEARLRLEWESASHKRSVVAQKHFDPGGRLSAQQVSALAVPAGQNLLLNPDFEGGDGGWLASASSNFQVVAPGRSRAGQAASATNWGWVQQNLPFTSIEGGATYTLEGWGRSVAGRACTMGLAGGNAVGDTFRETLVFEEDWALKSASRVVPVGTVWVAVYLSTSTTECQFDDLSLRIGDNLPPPQRTNANVLNNSDFENGTGGWDVLPVSAGSTGAGFLGSSLSISSWAWVQQDVAVGKLNLGQNYILRAAAKAENGARCTVGLVGASSSEISFSRTLAFGESRWSEQGLLQNIPQGTVWVAVYLSTTAEQCAFDQLALEPQNADELPNPDSFSPTYSHAAPTALSLTWGAVSQASSYVLERRSANTSYSTLATLTATSYTDTVTPETFYAYRLRAVRGGQTSSGLELRFTTPPAGPNGGTQAGSRGFFGSLFNWPVIPIHAALLPDGRVFSYGTRTTGQQGASVDYTVWNPSRGTGPNSHIRYSNATGTDIFCSSQLLLANGNVLVVGGDIVAANGNTTNLGNPDITIFNPLDDSLVKSPLQMLRGRWYSTATMLANGEVLITGGKDATNASSQVPEIY
ncbi:MAG: PA14 domain-containing protein, partial [Meiothermus sp.]|nr:PA14 domain-containing protein [Meiothermus sp.]